MRTADNPNRINGERLEFGNPKHTAYVLKQRELAARKAVECKHCDGEGSITCPCCMGMGEIRNDG